MADKQHNRRAPPSPAATPDLRWSSPEWPGDDSLQVWSFDRQKLQCLDGIGVAWLSRDERERWQRIGNSCRALAFARTRSAVRGALAAYLERDPAALRFAYGSHGKPALADGEGLEFSVSHSGENVLLAVACGTPLGVDLERSVPGRRDDLAERILGPEALAAYRRLPPLSRAHGFSWAWSEREAYVKAIGLGIGDGWTLVAALFSGLPLVEGTPSAGWRALGGQVLHYVDTWPRYAAVICSSRQAGYIDLLCPPTHGPALTIQRRMTKNLADLTVRPNMAF